MEYVNKQARYELKTREEKVLKLLIRDYVNSGHPVGSTRLANMENFKVGSATLRSVLSNLEMLGYLLQPHTSAGRVPTDKGYRYFVDRLMESDLPERAIVKDYESGIGNISQDLDQLIKNTAQFLGDMSHALVLMSKPQERSTQIRSLALYELDKESILLVVHTNFDQFKTMAIEIESRLSRLVLREAETILNDLFGGMNVNEVQTQIEAGSVGAASKNPVINAILNQFGKSLASNSAGDYRIYGRHQLLHYPEMSNPSSLEILLEAIETDNIQRFLPSPLRSGKPSVFIGSELGQSFFENMSLVSVAYNGSSCSGEIHILGPTRMEYEKVIGLAEFTAEKLEKIINTKYLKRND